MVLAIVLGALAGFIGFLPLFGGLQLTKRTTSTSNLGPAAASLLGVFGSFLILTAALVVCILFARDLVLPFTLALVGGLLVSTISYGAYKLVRK